MTAEIIRQEEWRPIPSFPPYEASTWGRIRSPTRVLKPWLDDDGFKIVCLYGVGRHNRYVHTLVCEAFHGPKPQWAGRAAHKNRRKKSNWPDNLCWATAIERPAGKRRRAARQGEDHFAATFTSVQISIIRAQYRHAPTAATIKRLAEAFIVSHETIRRIVRQRSWKAPARKRSA